MATYSRNLGIEIQTIDYLPTGRVDSAQLEKAMDDTVAGSRDSIAELFRNDRRYGRGCVSGGEVTERLSIVNVCEALSLGILRAPSEPTSSPAKRNRWACR